MISFYVLLGSATEEAYHDLSERFADVSRRWSQIAETSEAWA